MCIAAACLALVASGCGAGTSCGCGAPTGAPLSEHNLAFAGDHIVDARCVCRCGNDAPESFPADRACSDYETSCVDSAGSRSTFRCN